MDNSKLIHHHSLTPSNSQHAEQERGGEGRGERRRGEEEEEHAVLLLGSGSALGEVPSQLLTHSGIKNSEENNLVPNGFGCPPPFRAGLWFSVEPLVKLRFLFHHHLSARPRKL